jgi:DNA-binding NarL/FixJ family response regulator
LEDGHGILMPVLSPPPIDLNENRVSISKSGERPSVVLADDNTELLAALRKLLEPHFEVVATVDNGASLVRVVEACKPDLAVVDISMPKGGGIEAVEQVSGVSPTKCVFLTMHQEAAIVKRALSTGAFGYVLKGRAYLELVAALQEALHERRFLSVPLREKLDREEKK